MGQLLIFDSGDAFALGAAQWIAARIRGCVEARGRCNLMLAGGNTPRPVYRVLKSFGNMPWDRVAIYFGDERCVEPSDPLSNHLAAKQDLLDGLPLLADYRMVGESSDLDGAALLYEKWLPDGIDVLLLGMGEDGHTASIFPGSPLLGEQDRRIALVTDSQKPPAARLTITPVVIEEAREVAVLVNGSAKAELVARVLSEGRETRLPISLVAERTWILDRDAARLLDSSKDSSG